MFSLARNSRKLVPPSFSLGKYSTSTDDDLVQCHFERDGKVAILTLNDPTKMNAMRLPMNEIMVKKVEDLKSNANLRAAILTGAGN